MRRSDDNNSELTSNKLGRKLDSKALEKLDVHRAHWRKEWKDKKQFEKWNDIWRDPVSIITSLPFLPFLFFERKVSNHYEKRTDLEWQRKVNVHQHNASEGSDKSQHAETIGQIDQDIEKSRGQVKFAQVMAIASMFFIYSAIASAFLFLLFPAATAGAIVGAVVGGATLIGVSIGYGFAYLREREIIMFARENGSQEATRQIDAVIDQQLTERQEESQIVDIKRKIKKNAHKYGLDNITPGDVESISNLKDLVTRLEIVTGQDKSDLIKELDQEYRSYKSEEKKLSATPST